jgi:hypothetical protein
VQLLARCVQLFSFLSFAAAEACYGGDVLVRQEEHTGYNLQSACELKQVVAEPFLSSFCFFVELSVLSRQLRCWGRLAAVNAAAVAWLLCFCCAGA